MMAKRDGQNCDGFHTYIHEAYIQSASRVVAVHCDRRAPTAHRAQRHTLSARGPGRRLRVDSQQPAPHLSPRRDHQTHALLSHIHTQARSQSPLSTRAQGRPHRRLASDAVARATNNLPRFRDAADEVKAAPVAGVRLIAAHVIARPLVQLVPGVCEHAIVCEVTAHARRTRARVAHVVYYACTHQVSICTPTGTACSPGKTLPRGPAPGRVPSSWPAAAHGNTQGGAGPPRKHAHAPQARRGAPCPCRQPAQRLVICGAAGAPRG